METIRLGQLPHEDIAAVGIWAAELYWPKGHVTEYAGAGRLNNLLFWMQSGRRRYSVDGEVFEVGPGALLLMPAGSRYRTEVTDDGCRGVVLDFSLLDRTGQPVRLGVKGGEIVIRERKTPKTPVKKPAAPPLPEGARVKA